MKDNINTSIPNIYNKKALTSSLSVKSEYFIDGIHIDNELIEKTPEKLPLLKNGTIYPDNLFSEFICRYYIHEGSRYALWKDQEGKLFKFSEECYRDTFKEELSFFGSSAGDYLSCRMFSQYLLEIKNINYFSFASNKLPFKALSELMYGLYPGNENDPSIFKNLSSFKYLKDELLLLNNKFITRCLPPELAVVIASEQTQLEWFSNQIDEVSESDYIYECPDPDDKCRRIFIELHEREIISNEAYASEEIEEYVYNLVLAREFHSSFLFYIREHELCEQYEIIEYDLNEKLLLKHFLCFDSPLNTDISMGSEREWLTVDFKNEILSTIKNFMNEYGEGILTSINAFEKDFKESNIKYLHDKVWSSLPDAVPTL